VSFLTRTTILILTNSASVLLASYFIPGFIFQGNWLDLLTVGAILGIFNSLLKPILKFVTFPIIILTLGLFSIIINIVLLFLVARIMPNLIIHGFWAAFWGVSIISFVNYLIFTAVRRHH